MTTPSGRGIPPITQGRVGPEHLDANGHMNSTHYFMAHVHASREVLRRLGFTADYIAERRNGTFVAVHSIRYVAELRAEDDFAVRVSLVGRTDKALHLLSVLTNEATGVTSNVLEAIVVHVDQVARRATDFPDDLCDALDEAVRVGQADAGTSMSH